MSSPTELEHQIDEKVGEVRTEALDLSFGEIVNLYSNEEIIIHPAYQRLFRWSYEQRSKLVESILLQLPIPQIFFIENDNGVLELIDGLQRISSVIQFIDSNLLDKEPLELVGCELIDLLNGVRFNDLPLRLRLGIKRSAVRAVIIKQQSRSFLRYEMFQRLNTGGSILQPQEIRNCSARMLGDSGVEFYTFLVRMSEKQAFQECIATMSDSDREQRGEEELVLRFFALKNAQDLFRGSVRDWLDDYMEDILLEEREFDFDSEEEDFDHVFQYLAQSLGDGAFVKYRNNTPIGGLAPAYYEAVSIGTYRAAPLAHNVKPANVASAIIKTVQSDDFRAVTGSSANTKAKLEARIGLVQAALEDLY